MKLIADTLCACGMMPAHPVSAHTKDSLKLNQLGDFVMQTIAMWEEASKLPGMEHINYAAAIEILQHTYSVEEMTATENRGKDK